MEKQSFSVAKIEENLKKSLLAKYEPSIDKMISSNLKTSNGGEDNFAIPSIDDLVLTDTMIPELKEELLEKYNSHYGVDFTKLIPVNIKLEQAAMMDTLMFGYNLSTGAINLYTLNVELLFGLGVDNKKMIETCFKRNQMGIIHAYRIDIEYTSERTFFFKAVSLQSKNYIYADNYVLFPLLYIKRGMVLLKMFMEKGFVLKVTQDLGDIIKTRYITNSKTVLKKYCDCEEAVDSVNCSYFPLKGYMYAPVIGAPSTTSMVTKIDLFSISRIDPVRGYSEIDVRKVQDPIKNEVLCNSIMKRLTELSKGSGWDYVDIMQSLPDGDKVFKDELGRSVVDIPLVSKYLHTLDEDTLESLAERIPGCSDVMKKYQNIFTCREFVDFSNLSEDEVKKLLRTGVYKLVWIKSNCGYSSATVTNNKQVLRELYGEGYFGKYEGQNVRLNMLKYLVYKGYNIKESLSYCGFPDDEDLAKAAENFRATSGKEGSADYTLASNKFKKEVLNATGELARSESSTGSILVRTCFATENEDGSMSDFYRYISLPKVVRAIKIG